MIELGKRTITAPPGWLPLLAVLAFNALSCIALAGSTTTDVSMKLASSADDTPLRVQLQAKSSTDCFPVSALQLRELEVDFRRECPECVLVQPDAKTDFRLVVEDPELRWRISILDATGRELESFEWVGCLNVALRKATQIMTRLLPASN